jgi:hypothetical protein
MHGIKRRLRFRTSSLLWLMVVVTAFFVGQRSDEIGDRLRQSWQRFWAGGRPYRVLSQPDGSILIHCNSPVGRAITSDGAISSVEPIDTTRIRVKAYNDGALNVDLWLDDGPQINQFAPPLRLAFTIEEGNLSHTAK